MIAPPSPARLKEAILYLPTLYADVTWRPYGLLFHDATNPDSMDANHALILNPRCDVPQAAADIERFYRARCTIPTIYAGYAPGERRFVLPALWACGWRTQFVTAQFYCRTENVLPAFDPAIRVECPGELTAESAALLSECGGAFTLGVTERLLRQTGCRAYAARAADGTLAAWLTVVLFRGCGFIQDVATLPAYRKQGLCTALVARAVADFSSEWGYPLYLCAENPDAVRIYARAGFTPVSFTDADWWARKG